MIMTRVHVRRAQALPEAEAEVEPGPERMYAKYRLSSASICKKGTKQIRIETRKKQRNRKKKENRTELIEFGLATAEFGASAPSEHMHEEVVHAPRNCIGSGAAGEGTVEAGGAVAARSAYSRMSPPSKN